MCYGVKTDSVKFIDALCDDFVFCSIQPGNDFVDWRTDWTDNLDSRVEILAAVQCWKVESSRESRQIMCQTRSRSDSMFGPVRSCMRMSSTKMMRNWSQCRQLYRRHSNPNRNSMTIRCFHSDLELNSKNRLLMMSLRFHRAPCKCSFPNAYVPSTLTHLCWLA